MKRITVTVAFVLCTTLSGIWVWQASPNRATIMPFEGRVKSIKIHICGLQPGRCEGSMVLAMKEGEEVSLAIEPGIRIKRGEQLVTVDELGVGDYVQVQGTQIVGETPSPVTMREATTP